MKKHFLNRIAVLACAMLAMAGTVRAQDDDADKTLSPYFVVISEHPETDQLPLKETSADVTVVGSIADVTVRQVYVNSGKNPLEAIYTFPMSTRAAVYGMEMTIGTRRIRAQIEEKKKARADYEKAKQEGKRASLLEQSRPNVFTMNVSNIMVNDTIIVELKYTELLIPEKGVYSFVYPTVVGPRYSNQKKSQAGPDDGFVNSPYTHEGVLPAYAFNFKMSINSGIPIQDVTCTSHKMDMNPTDTRHTTLTLAPSEREGGNRDVIVNYSMRGSEIESGVMLYEGKDENFFLMMVQPPKRVMKENIPPREYIFIVDVSGSMWGKPMDITKQLMRNLIVNLRPTDMFNIVLFSGKAALFNVTSVAATAENVESAVNFIQSGSAYGGTEVLNALKTAYAIPRTDADIARTFVMTTDGYVNVEGGCFDMVRRNADNTNFFIFGIGTSVNRYMIEGMAFAGGGEPMIVTKMGEAAKQAERFREYISTPVLTRIKFNAGGFDVYDVEPVAIPDMMAERPIMVFGKYRGKANGTISLTGKVGRKSFKQSFDLSKVKADNANSAIRYLWARERIKFHDYMAGEYANEENPHAKEILALGLKYNLMTNYTSFIAIDEEVVMKDGKAVTVKQPLPLPEGVSDYAVGHDMAELKLASADVRPMKNNLIKTVEDEISDEEEIFVFVEQSAEFPGGEAAMKEFISKHLVYPEKAKKNKTTGTVVVSFTVEKDGSITNIKVLRDIGDGCGQAVIDVIKMMPKWIPAKQSGKPVRCTFNLPVQFQVKS